MRSPDHIGITWEENQLLMQQLRDKAALENRRQHNIFEVGDKVVSKENNEFVYTVITVDGGLGRLKNILFDHVYPLHNFRHATDAEIKAGKRLEGL